MIRRLGAAQRVEGGVEDRGVLDVEVPGEAYGAVVWQGQGEAASVAGAFVVAVEGFVQGLLGDLRCDVVEDAGAASA